MNVFMKLNLSNRQQCAAVFTIIFIIFALPIPIAVLGFVLSFIWLSASLIHSSDLVEVLISLLGAVIGSTYMFTYIFALTRTVKEQKITAKTFLPIAHCAVALAFLSVLKPASDYIDNSTKYFGFAKKDYSVVEEQDTHDGFLGDGSYYLILDCADNREQALETVKDWRELPLSENLNLIMYGGTRDGAEYRFNLAEEAHMPKIENGFYIFEDRHSESRDSADDSELFERYSFNFSLAVYDTDADKMYYFKFDT